jgi:hypothetical protein
MENSEFKQDIFFKNTPIKDENKPIDFMGITFLKLLNNPIYIWTGTGRILPLEKIKYREKIQKKLRKKEIYFYLYEPICFYIDEFNRNFYSEIRHDDPTDKITVDEFESIKIFTENNNIKNFKIFTCDYNIQLLQKNYPELNIHCLDIFLRGVSACYHSYRRTENNITNKFWCGNWRYTLHRHIITSYLTNYSGTYSWGFQCSYDKIKQNNWFDFHQLEKEKNDQYTKLMKGFEYLNQKTLSIDTDLDSIIVDNIENVFIPNNQGGQRNENFLKSFHNSFCAVINETRYAQPFGNFSEKTLNAIWAKLPFILVSPPYTLKYLKTFGFKTFDKWWDESYDSEEDHYKRMIKIFDLLDFINSKSIDELKIIYHKMDSILDNNRKIIKSIPFNNQVL